MARPKKAVILTKKQQELLQGVARSREMPHSLILRVEIVLKAALGLNNKKISQELSLCEDTVGLWRKRWLERAMELEKLVDKPTEWKKTLVKVLADQPRSGCPGKFEAEQICQAIALACETPPEYLSHWTRQELAREIMRRGIAETISTTTVGRFLKSGSSQATSKQILAQPRGRK